MISFEDYLCNRNDAIDNAAYLLICAMTAQDHNEPKEDDPAVPDWNMEIIGELVDAAEEIIQEKAGHTCHPFYCDSIPCYQTGDCKNQYCAFLQTDSKEGGM